MMKGRVLATLLGILSIVGLLAIYGTVQEPVTAVGPNGASLDRAVLMSLNDPRAAEAPSAPADVTPSTVNSISPAIIAPGSDFDLCFNVTLESPDQEYFDRFDVDLPDNWTIIEVHPVPNNSTCVVGTIAGHDPGNVAYWQADSPLPSECGAWSNGTYDFCLRISVPDCSGEPWDVPWNILGDNYIWTEPPHELSGVAGPLSCAVTGLHLTPDEVSTSGCPGIPEEFTLNLFNYTSADGTFGITYEVTSGNGTLTGPDQIYLGHGVDQDLIVVLTPWACLGEGAEVVARVTAEGNSYADSTWLYRTLDLSGCPDSGCRLIYLPFTLRDY